MERGVRLVPRCCWEMSQDALKTRREERRRALRAAVGRPVEHCEDALHLARSAMSHIQRPDILVHRPRRALLLHVNRSSRAWDIPKEGCSLTSLWYVDRVTCGPVGTGRITCSLEKPTHPGTWKTGPLPFVVVVPLPLEIRKSV